MYNCVGISKWRLSPHHLSQKNSKNTETHACLQTFLSGYKGYLEIRNYRSFLLPLLAWEIAQWLSQRTRTIYNESQTSL